MTKDAGARLDKDLEVVRRYTHLLNAEARVALAVRDAFDGANESYPGNHKIPTSLSDDSPLIVLICAALEYTPLSDKTPEALRKALEKWPVLRRQEKKAQGDWSFGLDAAFAEFETSGVVGGPMFCWLGRALA